MKKVLVLGGSGFVGRHLCEALNRRGIQVTVPTRRLPARSVQMLPFVTVVRANVHDADSLRQLIAGHDAVVNLVAVLHGDEARFGQLHVTLPTTVAQACLAAGVRRLVHVSALGADLQGPSMYQRSKAQGEQALQSLASAQGLALTVLRPSVIFGADDAFINLFARLQKVFPLMPLASAGTRFQPVSVQDVARALRALGLYQGGKGVAPFGGFFGVDVAQGRRLQGGHHHGEGQRCIHASTIPKPLPNEMPN